MRKPTLLRGFSLEPFGVSNYFAGTTGAGQFPLHIRLVLTLVGNEF
jgi:hypothetical protein